MTFTAKRYDFRDQAGDYARLAEELAALLSGESDFVANAANTAALVFDALPDLNWAGFYFLRKEPKVSSIGLESKAPHPGAAGGTLDHQAGGELVVGPFQGKPACVRIPLGKGVCGTAAVERKTIVVPDVNAFPGHIACDAASRSEIVVPLITGGGKLIGVLDIDSPRLARFNEGDARGLERIAAVFLDSIHGGDIG